MNLDKGILLEDTNQLLEWGQPIQKLAVLVNTITEVKPDRTNYIWGTHPILDGLELELTSFYWVFENKRTFNSIEHWAVGDRLSEITFNRISKHLTEKIGDPEIKDESNPPEKSWIWKLGKVTIHLYFFEQHAYKLSLTIKHEIK